MYGIRCSGNAGGANAQHCCLEQLAERQLAERNRAGPAGCPGGRDGRSERDARKIYHDFARMLHANWVPTQSEAIGMSDLWYVRRREEVKGPFKTSIVERFIVGDRIRDSDELSQDREIWQTLAELRSTFAVAIAERELESARAEAATDEPMADAEAEPVPVLDADDGNFDTPVDSGSVETMVDATAVGDDGVERTEEPESLVNARSRAARRQQVAATAPPIVPRRSGGLDRTGETPRMRMKQAASLISVMALIVVAGIAFLPSETSDSPDCAAPARSGVNWSNCRLEGRDLKGAELEKSSLRSVRLRDANLLGARLGAADLAYAELTNANLSYGDLAAAVAVGADLRGADLAYANLSGVDLTHADLSGANLGGVTLRGARLDHAIWIDGRRCLEGSLGGCKIAVGTAKAGQATKR